MVNQRNHLRAAQSSRPFFIGGRRFYQLWRIHLFSMAMIYLQSLGYSNVRNIAGGINAWIAAELPVVK
jgi:hypothetical protein